ncbi:HTTM domain-containing protein [Anatilimnocola sp. NA78]|uniref:HTTM domain-containing protein n=1 Tax=Anatilimnocola sp. NA78 TaxID=3415683 RepID=UPI003CE4612A
MMGSGQSLKTSWSGFAAAWQRFFHGRIDARRPALVRIGFSLLMLVYLAVLYPDLDTWFGPHGLFPAEFDEQRKLPQLWSVLRWINPSDPAASDWLHGLFWLNIVCVLMLLVGFCTRLNALAVFVLLVSWQNRNGTILEGEDTVFRLVNFYLLLMPSGRAWSIDSLLWRRQRDRCELVPAWGLRLLQLQMTVIFVAAGLHKLGGNLWLDGTALSYVGRLDDTFGRFPVPHLLFETPILVRLMTWTVIIVEVFVPGLLWFRETRHAALALLVLFHLSNEYAMFLFLFHWIMLVGWSTFLTSSDLQFFSRIFARRTTAP